MAAVHCVIIGFASFDVSDKHIWDYEKPDSDAHELKVHNINAYLVDAPNVIIGKRRIPICAVPEMNYGSMPIDDGHLILSEEDRREILTESTENKSLVRPYMGGDEFLNSVKRYCLWLPDVSPALIKASKFISERIRRVKEFRANSRRETTQNLASFPALFGEIRQPMGRYLLLPKVSSEQRSYMPIGFIEPDVIANGSALIIPDATLYHFGILTSTMHMAWMRATCGRMKSDYQYSTGIVYNNFPWPDEPTDKQRAAVEAAAQTVLDARAQFPQSSLADLYCPIMPPALVKVHQNLDRAVDACYRKAAFTSDAQRVEFLFERYQQLTSLLPMEKKTIKRKLKTN